MTQGPHDRRTGFWRDGPAVLLILFLGLAAEAAHFSWRDGRPVLNADSIQYLDAAEALLDTDRAPDFSLRKPGYPLVLAGVALLFGNMTWGALAANHLLLGLLPVAAYALGRILHSRMLGWAGAVLTVARLLGFVYGDRIMSEAACTCFLTFGVLALAAGLTGTRSTLWMLVSGVLLAAAWLVRSVAIVAVVGAVLCVLFTRGPRMRNALACCLLIAVPFVAAMLFECLLNREYAGRFRPSTGSFGLMLMMRARHLQGLPMPDTEVTRRCLDLLPERDVQDAYRVSEMDTWVARYRAVHDHGMDDWEVDALMKRAALQTIAQYPADFLQRSLYVFVRHLLRQRDGAHCASVPPADGQPSIVHPMGTDDPDFQDRWYAYWGLPNRALSESLEITDRLESAAGRRAPFSRMEPLPALRYVSMLPPVADVTGVLAGVASLWPGLALLLCGLLGLNRRLCVFLALAYVLDAVLVSLCCPSATAAARYQGIWLATDTTLAAALLIVPLAFLRGSRKAQV